MTNHWHGDNGCDRIECPDYKRLNPLEITTEDEDIILRLSAAQAEDIAWALGLYARGGRRPAGEWAFDLEVAAEKVGGSGRSSLAIGVVRF
jgi:hypothetical protein